jgi:hypothetical protein
MVRALFFNANLISFKSSLHAGISTCEIRVRQDIPVSAFADAVNDYVDNSETDDDGGNVMIEA